MKGRRTFTPPKAHTIRAELLALRRADRAEQRRIRARLRKQYEFYITGFVRQGGRGFTAAECWRDGLDRTVLGLRKDNPVSTVRERMRLQGIIRQGDEAILEYWNCGGSD